MLKPNICSTSGKAQFVVDSEAKMGKVAKKKRRVNYAECF